MQPARRRVVAAQIADHLGVRLDGDALGDEIFAEHLDEVLALFVLGVAARREAIRAEVGLAVELRDALGDAVRVLCSSLACSRNSAATLVDVSPCAMK